MKSHISAAFVFALVGASVFGSPPPPIGAVAYHSSGKVLAAGAYGEVCFIDAAKGEVLSRLAGQTQRVTALAYSKDGKRLAVASGIPGKSGAIRQYLINPDGTPGKEGPALKPHADIVYTLAFSTDGGLLASAGYDRVIRIVDPAKPDAILHQLTDHSDTVYAVAFHPNGKMLASASADRTVKLWDVATDKRLHTLSDSTDWLYTLAWSPDGKQLAAAGIDKSIRVWELGTEEPKLIRSAFAHTQPVTRLAYSSDGKSIFTSSEGPNVKRWDAAKLNEKLVFPAQSDTVLSLAVRPDDKQLAIGRFDGACLLLDPETGKTLAQPLPEKPKPPALGKFTPTFAKRGDKFTLIVDGQNLQGATELRASQPGIKIVLDSKKSSATRVEADVQISADAPLGSVTIGLHSPGGASNTLPFIVDRFAATMEQGSNESARTGTPVLLPVTLVGAIDRAGDADYFRFTAKAGQEIGVQVVAASIGSKLDPVLELTDETGKLLDESSTGLLGFVCPRDGAYSLGVRDKDFRGGTDMTYRIHVGPIPIAMSVFPLGVPPDARDFPIEVRGVNLGGSGAGMRSVKVTVPDPVPADRRLAVSLPKFNGEVPLGSPRVAIGEYREHNYAGALQVESPATINGVLAAAGETHSVAFTARKGERLLLEVHARRIGSPVDPFIEVLEQSGKPVVRTTLRCVARTYSVFRDHDSASPGIRIETWNDLAINDYLYVDGELMRIHQLPKNPDDDCQFYQAQNQRLGFLDTTPKHHSQGVAMYKVEMHPPKSMFPPNGMPVFDLPYRNDDGGPNYGKDSRIFFDPPADGTYRVRIGDARGSGGANHGYRLTIRRPKPDFSINFSPTAPAIWKGGALPLSVTVNRLDGFDGPVRVKLANLPAGVEAPETFIEAEQMTTTFAVYASAAAKPPAKSEPIKLVATATIENKSVVHEIAGGIVTLVDPGDIVTTTAVGELVVRPGQVSKMLVKVERRNGFKGRIPLEVKGLPHGVRVLNIGLNGILITERDTEREVQIYADPWVEPMEHPFVVLAKREGKNTEHAAKPVMLKLQR